MPILVNGQYIPFFFLFHPVPIFIVLSVYLHIHLSLCYYRCLSCFLDLAVQCWIPSSLSSRGLVRYSTPSSQRFPGAHTDTQGMKETARGQSGRPHTEAPGDEWFRNFPSHP